MAFNIIIDTIDPTVNKLLLDALKHFDEIKFISFKDIDSNTIIFKELDSLSTLKQFKHQTITQHRTVFITDDQELMFLSLDCYPLGFIRKTNLVSDLASIMTLIMDLNKNIEPVLTFKTGHSYIQIKTTQIIWIESFGHYLLIQTQTGQYKVREKLSSLEKRINPQQFTRVHKSYIVNRNFIFETQPQKLILTTGHTIPIGRKFK